MTAYHEANTVSRAIEALLPQAARPNCELIVICPDSDTAQAASNYPGVTVLCDPGKGKPAALNLGFQKAQGNLIVMTDGDVWVAPDALDLLLTPFEDAQVGAVSGRPISISPRTTLLGYWSHLLTDAGAHEERLERDHRGEFMVCSGYLYAIRSGLIKAIPEDALAEDGVISHRIGEQGYRIRYAPDARVYVRYPDTYHDWLIQKVRSTGGYAQPVISQSRLRMRTLGREVTAGLWRAIHYPRSLREVFWTILLIGARLHLWLLIFWRVKVRHEPLTELWKRVESTKS